MPMRLTARLAGLVAALLASLALAGPAEDYAAGERAYRRGDVREALAKLRPAADAGHAKAQVLLGAILDAAEQDEEAVRYLKLAAGQGEPDGMYLYAAMLGSGEGTPKDPVRAREWMEKSAGAGKREAVIAVAAAYLNGGFDLGAAERASPAALAWIQRAADIDHVPAVDRLAVAYRKGELGLAADERKALELEARSRQLRGLGDAGKKPTPARRPAVPKVPGG
jgi:TPR repeat protein